jgi:hypothetical protein
MKGISSEMASFEIDSSFIDSSDDVWLFEYLLEHKMFGGPFGCLECFLIELFNISQDGFTRCINQEIMIID